MNNTAFGTRLAVASGRDYRSTAAILDRLASAMKWRAGSATFGNVLPKGARVLIKPNMVLHVNEDPHFGTEELTTHASLIQAAAEAALRSDIGELVIGDAPIQSCDF